MITLPKYPKKYVDDIFFDYPSERNYIHICTVPYEHNPVPGIYFLYNNNELVYVGNSICIWSRLRNQRVKSSKKEWTHFSFTEINQEFNLGEVELALIYKLRPKYNTIRRKNQFTPEEKIKYSDLLNRAFKK